jgi:hypothetical protein
MTIVPAQHFVPWKVFGSQPTGQVVSAAVGMTDSIVASRRVLRDNILVAVVGILDVEKAVSGCVLGNERMRSVSY